MSPAGPAAGTVAEQTFEVLRHHGLTTMFSNPGSTEVPFLALLPDDFTFILGLHEGSVVGMATGYAIANDRAALVLVHTTAGLGNAVAGIATARVNRAPLVVVVGQQDRRHLAFEPFLTGRLAGLAGDYPLAVLEPGRGADVPAAIARAAFTAEQGRGPVIVIVPMSDWLEAAEPDAMAAPARVTVAAPTTSGAVHDVAAILRDARSPALVVGAGMDTEAGWAAAVELAELLGAPVRLEPFGARAAFPQDHPLYAGQVPADRTRVREAFGTHDAVVVLGTAALRQYPYQEGPLFPPGTRVVLMTADAAEANRSPAELAIVGDPAALTQQMAAALMALGVAPPEPAAQRTERVREIRSEGPLRAADVFALMADLLPEDAVVIEESPSSRPVLQAMLPARRPLSFLSAAMGGLGFALPAAIGVRMALPERPVVAVVGDGSSLYCIQALWTAASTGTGALFIVLANGGYAVMDRLAEQRNAKPAWPAFPEVSVRTLAGGFGVEAVHVDDHEHLAALLADVLPSLAGRSTPLLIEVGVAADTTFQP